MWKCCLPVYVRSQIVHLITHSMMSTRVVFTCIGIEVRLAAALPPAAQRRRPRPRRQLAVTAASDPAAVQLLPLRRASVAAAILVHDCRAEEHALSALAEVESDIARHRTRAALIAHG